MSGVLVITGPTATGKTALGVRLAKLLGGEVVSADSMQVYKYMDIGTAKPTPEETEGVPHHMIDVVSPFESYSVSRYVEDAAAVCRELSARGKLPVIVGGTGLYIEALISGWDFERGPGDGALRQELSALYDELGGERMLERLARTDSERAGKLHPHDKKRIVRALEIAENGGNISRHDRETRAAPPRFQAKTVVLGYADRADLYERIDRRVDGMMARGLVGEVEKLLAMGLTPEHTAMQAIGYKELCAALAGKCSLDEAVETVKRESRRYAKRQISWCKRYEDRLDVIFEKVPDFEKAVSLSTNFLKELV